MKTAKKVRREVASAEGNRAASKTASAAAALAVVLSEITRTKARVHDETEGEGIKYR